MGGEKKPLVMSDLGCADGCGRQMGAEWHGCADGCGREMGVENCADGCGRRGRKGGWKWLGGRRRW